MSQTHRMSITDLIGVLAAGTRLGWQALSSHVTHELADRKRDPLKEIIDEIIAEEGPPTAEDWEWAYNLGRPSTGRRAANEDAA